MTYKLAVINTSTIGIEHVSNLLIAIGVGGFEVCDSEDFNEFLKTCTPAYDYVDEKLMKLASERSTIKFYTADNEQGSDTIFAVEKALLELTEEYERMLATTERLNLMFQLSMTVIGKTTGNNIINLWK